MTRHFKQAAIVAALFFAVALPARADQLLRLTAKNLSDNSTVSTTVVGVGGIASFNGSLGGFTVNVSTGLSLGTPSAPKLDLNTVNVLSSAVGWMLTIEHTETNFGPIAPGGVTMTAAAGGTTNGAVGYRVFVDGTNDPFGQMVQKSFLGPYSSIAFSSSEEFQLCAAGCNGPFSITQVVTLNHRAGENLVSSGDFLLQAAVPEPQTITLFGLGLTLLGVTAIVSERRKKAVGRSNRS